MKMEIVFKRSAALRSVSINQSKSFSFDFLLKDDVISILNQPMYIKYKTEKSQKEESIYQFMCIHDNIVRQLWKFQKLSKEM